MSHVVSVDVEVKDLEALEAAAERCGLVAVSTDAFDWYGTFVGDYRGPDAAYRSGVGPTQYGTCDCALVQADSPLGRAELAARAAGRRLTAAEAAAVRVGRYGAGWRTCRDKPYSVGVVARPEGGYRLVYDAWQGGHGLMAKIGPAAATLKQAYGVCAARAVAARSGHRIVAEQTLPDGTVRLSVQLPAARIKTG